MLLLLLEQNNDVFITIIRHELMLQLLFLYENLIMSQLILDQMMS